MLGFGTTPTLFENIAYFLTRTSTSIAYKFLRKVVLGKRDTAEILNLCMSIIRNMRRIGAIGDRELDDLASFMLNFILERRNPIELVKFILVLINQCFSKIEDKEVELFKQIVEASCVDRKVKT